MFVHFIRHITHDAHDNVIVAVVEHGLVDILAVFRKVHTLVAHAAAGLHDVDEDARVQNADDLLAEHLGCMLHVHDLTRGSVDLLDFQ